MIWDNIHHRYTDHHYLLLAVVTASACLAWLAVLVQVL
jgi:hypothetical protein